jgi:hypothetical protein
VWCQDADIPEAQPIIAEEIERYLLTGKIDPLYSAWSGSFLERANRSHDDLRGALVRAVRRLTKGLVLEPCGFDSSAWTLANLYLASLGRELLG